MKKTILAILILLFGIIILTGCGNTITTSSNPEKQYKYISETIIDSQSTYKFTANKDITEDEMKLICDEYDNRKSGCKIWLYETEDDINKLDSYNIAEIKKENGEYKIHRYGEETEEEKAIRLEQERLEKEEAEKKKEEERLQKEAEEKAKKEKEETDFKASCKTYTFKEMARKPDDFKGTNVKLTGEVVQAMYGSYSTELRVNITKQGSYSTYYTDTVYVTYYPKEGEGKILEDDIITIWGTSFGDTSYTSTLGATITLPYISAKYIQIN